VIMAMQVIRETHFPGLKLASRGKVRDIYDLEDTLLIVTTDRMSAFDVVMDDPIPDKGKVLNKISLFWFEKTSSIIGNHVITANPGEYPEVCKPYRNYLEERSMLVRKARPLPVCAPRWGEGIFETAGTHLHAVYQGGERAP